MSYKSTSSKKFEDEDCLREVLRLAASPNRSEESPMGLVFACPSVYTKKRLATVRFELTTAKARRS